ncbi:hypothetical protein BV25DRAFT_1967651 [Artomyces pyxidatus]|uniref:Uncharacterized protein n=1 Tax=Artomyces pyxidatus TaxID=48021 RepID=A0ACB8TFH4_9AGAM|nr:hypothetical protein BV25DRAFT_1967651 [Artomyces pyxidatus]
MSVLFVSFTWASPEVPELLDDTKAAVGSLSPRGLAPLSWSLDPPRTRTAELVVGPATARETVATREGGKLTDGEVLQANAALDIELIASRGEPSTPRLHLPQLGRVPVPTEEVSASQPENVVVAKEDENELDADAPTAPALEVIESDSPVMGRKKPELGSKHLSGASVTPQTPPRDSHRSYLPEMNMSPIISESPLVMKAIVSSNIATAGTSLPVPAEPIGTPPNLQNATIPPSDSHRAPLTYVSYNSMTYAQGVSRASELPPESVRPHQRPPPQMLSPWPVSDTTLVSPHLSGSMQQTAKFSAEPPASFAAPLMRSSSLRAGLGIKSLFRRTERFSMSTSNPLPIVTSPMGPEEVARRKRAQSLKSMIGEPIPIGLGVEGIGLGVSIASVGDLTMIGRRESRKAGRRSFGLSVFGRANDSIKEEVEEGEGENTPPRFEKLSRVGSSRNLLRKKTK